MRVRDYAAQRLPLFDGIQTAQTIRTKCKNDLAVDLFSKDEATVLLIRISFLFLPLLLLLLLLFAIHRYCSLPLLFISIYLSILYFYCCAAAAAAFVLLTGTLCVGARSHDVASFTSLVWCYYTESVKEKMECHDYLMRELNHQRRPQFQSKCTHMFHLTSDDNNVESKSCNLIESFAYFNFNGEKLRFC